MRGGLATRFIGSALLILVLTFTACSKGAPLTSAPSPTGSSGSSAPAASSAPVVDTAPTSGAESGGTAGAFFLEIAAPKDESVVRESTLTVQGQTAPDAVVSVNGLPVEVDASGNFSVTVALDPGPNPIEVIASDFSGNQQSRVISVIYTG